MKRLVTLLALAAALSAGCSNDPGAPTPLADTSEPPRISCPAPVSQVSPAGDAVTVVYGTPSITGGSAPISNSCTPTSGSAFAAGTNTVTCTASDARQRTASCAFAVIVQKPAIISVTRFMAFGDSITRGEDGRALTASATRGLLGLMHPSFVNEAETYPSVLNGLLASRYLGQTITMVNEGSPGELAGDSDTVPRFSRALGVDSPQVILLMEGSNDILNGDRGPIGSAIANLRTMARAAGGRRVYLATVPPMDPANDPDRYRGHRGYATVAPLNDEIRRLALELNVPLVDVNAAFNGNVSLLADGLHPNAEGYALIANQFFAAVQRDLETSGPMNARLPATLRSH